MYRAIPLVVAVMLIAPVVPAAGPTVVDIAGELEAFAIGIEAEREDAIRNNLSLSPEQARIFWPIYEEYRVAIGSVTDRDIQIVTDYVELYRSGDISDEEAKILLEAALDTDADGLQIRQEYMSRLLEQLPAKKVARFYQLENRLDALARIALMKEIPLMETASTR
jgi:hypothetical protein